MSRSQKEHDERIHKYSVERMEREAELESLRAEVERLRGEADYYKSLITSDQRYEEGQMDERLHVTKEANEIIERMRGEMREAGKVLEKVEWSQYDSFGRKRCPVCLRNKPGVGIGNEDNRDHKDCALASRIAEIRKAVGDE